MKFLLRENIRLSFRSIRSQLLRTFLTMLIISIGIASLVGTLTAIDSIKNSINSNFTSMGANTFTVRNRETTVRIGKGGKRPRRYRAIEYDEAKRFKEEFQYSSATSLSAFAAFAATVKYKSKKTNPNIQVMGSDEAYLHTSGYELERGRNFSAAEIANNSHVVLMGKDLITTLFERKDDPVDKIVTIGSGKYKIIGILKSKGSAMGFGGDKMVILPLTNVQQYFPRPNMSYTINVLARNTQELNPAVGEATGLLRKIRKVSLGEEDNFEITKSDNLANILIDNIQKVTMGATLIGIITLLGAAIGLMNIMLVSVTERTREIGIRKAIGATRRTVRTQFLIEATVICVLGGLFGILLGMVIGNLVSYGMNTAFFVPWKWIFGGLGLCVAVGLISGIYPAVKASRLDPIEALRFE